MATLLMSLPPLSPDYCGVASVLHDLGGLVVIHDASGCTGTYTGYDEPRWFTSRSPVFCSGLREMDAILGNDEKLLAKVQALVDDSPVPFAAVVGSPVPMLVGFDYHGFASLAEHRTGVPTLGFETTGLGLYDAGQKAAYRALARRFLPDQAVRVPRGVNLLGVSPQDGFDETALDRLGALVNRAGLSVVSVWGRGSTLDELRQAPGAAVNWVLSAAALPVARDLEARFGIPFVAGLPLGRAEEFRLVGALTAAVAGEPTFDVPGPKPRQGDPPRILVVGEALWAVSLRRALRAEARGPVPEVVCATLFGFDPSLREEGDQAVADEPALTALLTGTPWTAVVADPLIGSFLPPEVPLRPFAHPAVSGRLHHDSVARFFGVPGSCELNAILGGSHVSA